MSRKRVVVWIIITGLPFWFFLQIIPARAQDGTLENDSNCVACHEHRYYLYDDGNWFCLCKASMHCVYCHGGRINNPVKELAHEGIVLYPTRDHAIRCQACHTEDYLSRVVALSSLVGIGATPQAIIPATPFGTILTSSVKQPNFLLLRLSQLEPWRLVGLGMVLIMLIVIFLFGFRCWKVDCLAKTQPHPQD